MPIYYVKGGLDIIQMERANVVGRNSQRYQINSPIYKVRTIIVFYSSTSTFNYQNKLIKYIILLCLVQKGLSRTKYYIFYEILTHIIKHTVKDNNIRLCDCFLKANFIVNANITGHTTNENVSYQFITFVDEEYDKLQGLF